MTVEQIGHLGGGRLSGSSLYVETYLKAGYSNVTFEIVTRSHEHHNLWVQRDEHTDHHTWLSQCSILSRLSPFITDLSETYQHQYFDLCNKGSLTHHINHIWWYILPFDSICYLIVTNGRVARPHSPIWPMTTIKWKNAEMGLQVILPHVPILLRFSHLS